MSLTFIDGFDGYGFGDLFTPEMANFQTRMYSSGWSHEDISYFTASSNTRTGIGYSARSELYGSAVRAFNPSPGVVVGCAINYTAYLGYRAFLELLYDNYTGTSAVQCSCFVNPTGALSIWTPITGLFHTPVNTVYPDTWHYFELKLTYTGLVLDIEVRVDGNTVAVETGVLAPGASVAGVANLLRLNAAPVGVHIYYDDLYLISVDGVGLNDFLGDCVVHTLLPATDASPNEMAQFGGGVTHASAVNGFPNDQNSAYLYSNVANQSELFTISTLPTDMVDVLAMQVNVRARKDSAGVAKYKIALKSGATLALSPEKTPTTSFSENNYIWEQNPAGGAWTKIAAQNSNIGFKVI